MDQLQKERFFEMLDRYNAGTAAPEEIKFLEAYYKAFEVRKSYTEQLPEERRMLLKDDLAALVDESTADGTAAMGNRTRSIIRWSLSLAALLTVVSVYFIYRLENRMNATDSLTAGTAAQDIAPGGNKAVLTLSNGKKISLTDADNGTLAELSGVKITKAADGQVVYTVLDEADKESKQITFNTIETPMAGRYQIRLPDGSDVWLNAASRLVYPSSFKGQPERRVELSGEAYFEIAKNKDQPFIVKSSDQEVEVLGTHFNINSYDDEQSVKTTLLEGLVKIKKPGASGAEERLLKPGQQATLAYGRLDVQNIDTDLIVAWKNNQFVFDSDDIAHIMRMIARWYDVEVEYVGSPPQDKFWGSVSRFENVSEVLKTLEVTGRVKFKIKDRKIYVSR